MRARKVVTRSGKRFRGKFPSKKNAIMVQWESLLERDAILMFEYHCEVRTYQEQPSVEAYYDDAHRPHRYYPDFGVIVKEGQQILYEVKHEVDLAKPHIKRKLEAVAKRLAEQGRPFRILTEKEIRRTPLFTNLQRLHASSKQRVSSSDLSHFVDKLSGGPVWTFLDIAGQLGSEAHALALIGSHPHLSAASLTAMPEGTRPSRRNKELCWYGSFLRMSSTVMPPLNTIVVRTRLLSKTQYEGEQGLSLHIRRTCGGRLREPRWQRGGPRTNKCTQASRAGRRRCLCARPRATGT